MISIRSPYKEWVPAALWLGIIALESTGLASASNTSWLLFPIFHFLTGVARDKFIFWNHLFRKIGHFVGYGFLSFLLFRAWRVTVSAVSSWGWAWRWTVLAFLSTALVASLDEWHQSYLPSRTGRWQDVVLDSSAALCVQIVIWLVLRRHKPPYEPQTA